MCAMGVGMGYGLHLVVPDDARCYTLTAEG